MTKFTMGRQPGEFLLSEAGGARSRGKGTVVAGSGIFAPGCVMGIVGLGAAVSAIQGGGNTGNGVLTLDAIALGDGAQSGVYAIEMLGGAFDAAIAAAAGNTGNGTAAMNVTKTAAGVAAGIYQAVFVEAVTDGGRFIVTDPAGVTIGQGVVGTLFDGVVKFTISDGATDFKAGDRFLITVSDVVAGSGLSTFSVVGPDGVALANGVVGTPYEGQINFAIADGSTNFIVGDGFRVTVAAGSLKYAPSPDAITDGIEGAETAVAVALYGGDATTVDIEIAFMVRDCEVNGLILSYDASVDDAPKQAVKIAQLAEQGIIVR